MKNIHSVLNDALEPILSYTWKQLNQTFMTEKGTRKKVCKQEDCESKKKQTDKKETSSNAPHHRTAEQRNRQSIQAFINPAVAAAISNPQALSLKFSASTMVVFSCYTRRLSPRTVRLLRRSSSVLGDGRLGSRCGMGLLGCFG